MMRDVVNLLYSQSSHDTHTTNKVKILGFTTILMCSSVP